MTIPAESQLILMCMTLSHVASTEITERPGDALAIIDLKDKAHLRATFRAISIVRPLNPIRPATRFVTLSSTKIFEP